MDKYNFDNLISEVSRDVSIDENKYTQFIDEYKNTYFKKVYDVLSERYKYNTPKNAIFLVL